MTCVPAFFFQERLRKLNIVYFQKMSIPSEWKVYFSVIKVLWPGKALSQNLTPWLRGSTGSVTGNYLERLQQQSELRSNDIVLIQECSHRIFTKHCYLSRKHNFNGFRKAIKKS